MKNKAEFIQSLERVKLVLGNGFDLHCGLKTEYKDYFLSNKEKNDYFKYWIINFKNRAKEYLNFKASNHKESWREFRNFEKYNVWDFFFYVVSNIEADSQVDWNWCDVEQVMLQWLYNYQDKNHANSKESWKEVYEVINVENTRYHNYNVYLLAAVVYKKHYEAKFKDENDFYSFLLSQLELFEYSFGEYIYKQNYDSQSKKYDVWHLETNIRTYSLYTINSLCNKEQLVSIESFNYDFIGIEELRSIFHNINGNIDNPIFGIDSSAFLPPDPRYIFSKTNRRMENDMVENDIYEHLDFSNVIIYGHSLTTSDYSYFFSIFDKLNIIDLTNKSVIVFAYSIYDNNKVDSIMSDYRLAISKLFTAYSQYKGNNESPNRLLDALTTQGKILLYEIYNIIVLQNG